jgi:hypothetical protein
MTIQEQIYEWWNCSDKKEKELIIEELDKILKEFKKEIKG